MQYTMRRIQRTKEMILISTAQHGKKPVLLFGCFGVDPTEWVASLIRSMPDLDIRVWPEAGLVDEIDYVLVWNAPSGFLQRFSNLRVIFSMGAGVDKLLRDVEMPPGVPLVRMVDPSLVSCMNEFVLLSVLRYHRSLPVYEMQQREKRWEQIMSPLSDDRVVGILGLGQLGGRCAQSLAALGFNVRGWSRASHAIEGVASFHGPSELKRFLQGCEILVCLLPLTPDTRDLLNKDLFEELPVGAFVINASRGDVLVEEDLLAALESGHLAGATLDVFRQEPLPHTHPFWHHPKVTVIPHAAALTQPKTAARTVTENIARDRAGQPLLNVVDLATGY